MFLRQSYITYIDEVCVACVGLS